MRTASESFDELELRIFGGERNTHRVELLLPDGGRESSTIRIPSWRALQGLDPHEYGVQLSKALFQGPVANAFWRARSVARIPDRSFASELGLRLHLWLDPGAPALHTLNWESLWDLERAEPLSVGVAFSRYVRTDVPPREAPFMGATRMLLIVCNPNDVGPLPEIIAKTVASWSSRLWDERIRVDFMPGQPTLAKIASAGKQQYDLLHLMIRSIQREDGRYLVLAREGGSTDAVQFEVVGEALSALAAGSPSLMFVAVAAEDAPGSGKRADGLGPKLVSDGARAAVVIESAMSGTAMARFTEKFYRDLMESGIADQAMASARRQVFAIAPQSWDWAVPTLYTRSQERGIGIMKGGFVEVQQVAESVEGTVTAVKIGKLGGKSVDVIGGDDARPK